MMDLKENKRNDSGEPQYLSLKDLPNPKRLIDRILFESLLLVLYLLVYCFLSELPSEGASALICYLYCGFFMLYFLTLRLYLLSKEAESDKRILIENLLFGILVMFIVIASYISDFIGKNLIINNVKDVLSIIGIIYVWLPLPKRTNDKQNEQIISLRRQCFLLNMVIMIVLLFVL